MSIFDISQKDVNGATLFGVALTLFALRNEVNFFGSVGYWIFVIGCFVFGIFSVKTFISKE